MASQDATRANAVLAPLISARDAALRDPELYKQVLPPVLGLMSEKPSVHVRRWVAGFIAEALGSVAIHPDEKEHMILTLLPAIRRFLEDQQEDGDIVKNAVVAASVAYPLGFRHVTYHPEENDIWDHLQSIKNSILNRMDSYPPGIKACCIKFVQRVVQTQTPGTIDPRRPDKNETSLALAPRDHPLIHVSHVEAETSGLLDRILGVLQDETSDALLITATINALGGLVKSRAAIANKIINTILAYNPLTLAGHGSITTMHKILIRSVERTIKALFFNILKRTPAHPQAARMQEYLERLSAGRIALFEDSRKRPAPGNIRQESPKKQRMEPSIGDLTTLPLGPVSFRQLFTLSTDPSAQPFDVTAIPISTVAKILVPLLRSVDGNKLDEAITIMQARISSLAQRAAVPPADMSVEDDDDYEPDFSPIEDSEQIQNRMDMESSEELGIGLPSPSQVRMMHFKLPDPLQLTGRDLEALGRQTMDFVFRKIEAAPPKAIVSTARKTGFNRLAATGEDRESRATTFARLLSRPTACSPEEQEMLAGGLNPQILNDRGRIQMLQYILSNWKSRMDIATTWLTEEWYNDQVCKQAEDEGKVDKTTGHQPNFPKWAHRFLDELSAFIGTEDSKLLIRFVSDIPGLDKDIIAKIKRLALDPERITMVVNAIHFLILFRPPVKDTCLDALEDMWKSYEGAKPSTAAILKKFRPAFLEADA